MRTSPDHLAAVSLEHSCRGWRELTWDRRSPVPGQPQSRRCQRVLIDGPQSKDSEQSKKDGDDRRDNPDQRSSRCHARLNLTSSRVIRRQQIESLRLLEALENGRLARQLLTEG